MPAHMVLSSDFVMSLGIKGKGMLYFSLSWSLSKKFSGDSSLAFLEESWSFQSSPHHHMWGQERGFKHGACIIMSPAYPREGKHAMLFNINS